MKNILFPVTFILILSGQQASSQGCNDAGLCTMGDLDGQSTGTSERFNTQLTYTFGLGEKQTLINTAQFEQRFDAADNRLQFFLKVPFHYIYGGLGHTYGPGDLSLGINYTYLKKEKLSASFMIASRIPSGDAGMTIEDRGAPMVYQPSLGNYDLAMGASVFFGKWQFGVGYQKPLGSNKNFFSHAEWQGNDNALEYMEMKDLARGDDGMLRLNRFFFSKKARFNTGMLVLYRLQKDKVTQGIDRVALDHSDGLTLNMIFGYHQVLANNDAVTITAAAPLITREVRVDGLTRTFVLMFTYSFGWGNKAAVFKPARINPEGIR